MKRFLFLICLILFFFTKSISQHITNGQKKLEIPFQLENDFIIVDVQFNNMLQLKFIFDTGAEYTILTKREYADILGIQYEKEFNIMGADMSSILTAYLARGINLKVGEVENPNQDFLVMGDDYFKFESLTGVPVQGIIGANFFSRYVLSIDYRRSVINLYDPQYFEPPSDFEEIPITVHKNKPYLQIASKLFAQDTSCQIKLLIDTGASLSLLVYTDTHHALRLPEKVVKANIGKGLGGIIEGSMGRFNELNMGPFKLKNLVASFQEISDSMFVSELNHRNGLVGNVVLSRFDVIIDYYKQKLYLRPNKTFKKDFKFDRSGIVFFATGTELDTYTINYIVPGSPADEAGILKGDQIKRINGLSAGYISMSSIIRKLQGKIGKKIKLVLIRNEEKVKLSFRLRDII